MLRSFSHHGPADGETPPGPAPDWSSDARFSLRSAAATVSRPRTGNLKPPSKPGDLYGVEFSLNGERQYVSFPGSEGWDEARAVDEQRYLMEKVNRGEWEPERPAPAPARTRVPLYRDFAAESLARRIRKLEGTADAVKKRAAEIEYHLSIGMQILGPLPVDAVDENAVEDLVMALRDQRLAIQHARELGEPLMESYVDGRTGKTHQRRARGLGNGTINLAINATQAVLKDAHKRHVIARLPDLSDEKLKGSRPRRSYLQIVEIAAVFAAADAIEADARGLDWEKVRYIRSSTASAVALARELHVSDTLIRDVRHHRKWNGSPERPNRNDVPRRAPIEALVLLGPRVAELCGWLGYDVDLAAQRVRIRREVTKTDAGERVIPMLPGARARLIDHKARRPYSPGGPVFATRNGTPNTPNKRPARRPGPGARARQRDPRGRRAPADRTPHAAHAAAHLRLDPRRLPRRHPPRRRAARAHRRPHDDGGLRPAAQARRRQPRAARNAHGLHLRRGPRDLRIRASSPNQLRTSREKGPPPRRSKVIGT
jgi:integrase